MTETEKKSDVFTLSNITFSTQLTRKNELQQEYNPFENRPQENLTSTAGAFAHLLKGLLGTGMLAMPMAFKNGGLLLGFLGTIFAAIIVTHCMAILVRTSQDLCKVAKTPTLGFAETAEKVCEYGPPGVRKYANVAKIFVDVGLLCTYFGACCVYLLFISDSVENVVENRLELGWNIRIYIAFTTIAVIFIGQIRELKYLVPFSTVANAFIVIAFSITLYYMFDVPQFDFSDKPLIASFKEIPLFFATVVFALEAVGVVLPIENAMTKPQHFVGCPGVLNTAMTVGVLLYSLMGFFGYVRYGASVRASITLNLARGEILADIAVILMALAVMSSYTLTFYICKEIVWRRINYMIHEDNYNIAEYILRTLIAITTGVTAAAVPKLDPFIGLVGAVFFSVLGLVVPVLIESISLWPGKFGKGNWILWKNILIGFVGILTMITGSAVSVSDIIAIYWSPDA